MKKLLSLLLVALMLISFVACKKDTENDADDDTAKTTNKAEITTEPVTTEAFEEDEPIYEEKEPDLVIEKSNFEGFDYVEFHIYDGKATFVQCIPYDKEIIIPKEVDGYPVVAIGKDIPNIKDATDINTAQDYSIIEPAVFGQPGSCGTLKIHSNIEYISPTALSMSKIEYIEVDSANTHYRSVDGALYSKDMTTLVRVPKAMDFSIPYGVTEIAPHAFFYWYPETSRLSTVSGYEDPFFTVSIPQSVETIGEGAFAALLYGKVEVDSANKHFCSKNGALYTADMKKLIFHSCFDWSDTAYTVPYGVEEIASGAFFRCNHSQLVLTDSVKTIESYAFNGMRNTYNINIPKSVEKIGDAAFYSAWSGAANITVDEGNQNYVVKDGNLYNADMSTLMYHMCDGSSSLEIPSGVKRIAPYAFTNSEYSRTVCAHRKIELPNTVKTIGKYAFYCCELLENIYIPSIKSIGEYAFAGCMSLKKITIPEGVTVLKPYTLYGCEKLEAVYLPSSITKIDENNLSYYADMHTIICEKGSFADKHFTELGYNIQYATEPSQYTNRKFGVGMTSFYDEDYYDFFSVATAAVLLNENGVIEDCVIKSYSLSENSSLLDMLDSTNSSNYMVPRMIEKSRFENEILGKLDREDPYENWAYAKLSAFYKLEDPNDTTLAYSTRQQMYENYPVTETGMAIYVLAYDIYTREIEELEGYIKEYTDYTYDDLEYDHALTQYGMLVITRANEYLEDYYTNYSFIGKTLDDVKATVDEMPEAACVVKAIENADNTSADKQSDTVELGMTVSVENSADSSGIRFSTVGAIADLSFAIVDVDSDTMLCIPFEDENVFSAKENKDSEQLSTLEIFNNVCIGLNSTTVQILSNSIYPTFLTSAIISALN